MTNAINYTVTKLSGGRAIAVPAIRAFCEANGITVANRKSVTDAQMLTLAKEIADKGITNAKGVPLSTKDVLGIYVRWVFHRDGENMIATTESTPAPAPLLADKAPADDSSYGVETEKKGKKAA